MRWIYHIIPRPLWERAPKGPFRAETLATEGFIHCSNRDQVTQVANLFYADHPELLLLCIDTSQLSSLLSDEDIGTGERFPHVYGPIEREAIVEVRPLERDRERRWVLPQDLAAP